MRLELTEAEAARVVSVLRSVHGGAEINALADKIEQATRGTGTAEIAPGVRVKVAGNINPKYALGMVGKVLTFPTDTAHRRVRVLLDPDQPGYFRMTRFLRPDGTISFPGNCLEVIS